MNKYSLKNKSIDEFYKSIKCFSARFEYNSKRLENLCIPFKLFNEKFKIKKMKIKKNNIGLKK